MAKAPKGASRRSAATPVASARSVASDAAPATSISPASSEAAPTPETPVPATQPKIIVAQTGGQVIEALMTEDETTQKGLAHHAPNRRWLKLETGLCGPDISLARGDRHPFCDIPGEDDAPSEAQRLVNAGFAVDCDPPVEG